MVKPSASFIIVVCIMFISSTEGSNSNCHMPQNATNMTNKTIPSKGCQVKDLCKSPTITKWKIFTAFLSVELFVAVTGNAAVCIVILSSRYLRSQVTNYFIISLAVSDIFVTLFTLPVRILETLHNWNFCVGLSACRLFFSMDALFNVASVTNLFLITIDRFLAITQPFQYNSMMSSGTALLLIGCTWVYSSIWSGLSVFDWNNPSRSSIQVARNVDTRTNATMEWKVCQNVNKTYYTTVFSAVFIIPLLIMGVMYVQIWKQAIKHARSITALECIDQKESKMKRDNRHRREVRATKTIAIVYGAFLVCWLPVCVISISANWCQECFSKFRRENPVAFDVIYFIFVYILPPLNSCLNPLIYTIFSKQFRVGLKALMVKCRCGDIDKTFRRNANRMSTVTHSAPGTQNSSNGEVTNV